MPPPGITPIHHLERPPTTPLLITQHHPTRILLAPSNEALPARLPRKSIRRGVIEVLVRVIARAAAGAVAAGKGGELRSRVNNDGLALGVWVSHP
eukprot:CAMPEP_0172478496 /NCGR_PEP_ID=MMETSP1066-20121228/2531_1 /TAXON_ID=671091 /ORGANISM="Coscinodiscus wailesii, Strain CCMP2513" /LENGTH=94 /DNA_ID=CAMNT_0013238137 /DNA_START=137 /DNA_END=421 /DNA_ORIENTATION=+